MHEMRYSWGKEAKKMIERWVGGALAIGGRVTKLYICLCPCSMKQIFNRWINQRDLSYGRIDLIK
jgi:hypothetical protein